MKMHEASTAKQPWLRKSQSNTDASVLKRSKADKTTRLRHVVEKNGRRSKEEGSCRLGFQKAHRLATLRPNGVVDAK